MLLLPLLCEWDTLRGARSDVVICCLLFNAHGLCCAACIAPVCRSATSCERLDVEHALRAQQILWMTYAVGQVIDGLVSLHN